MHCQLPWTLSLWVWWSWSFHQRMCWECLLHTGHPTRENRRGRIAAQETSTNYRKHFSLIRCSRGKDLLNVMSLCTSEYLLHTCSHCALFCTTVCEPQGRCFSIFSRRVVWFSSHHKWRNWHTTGRVRSIYEYDALQQLWSMLIQ